MRRLDFLTKGVTLGVAASGLGISRLWPLRGRLVPDVRDRVVGPPGVLYIDSEGTF